ncbi:SpaH/EbpB family LPXTG-anchored major pilin [Corynebacterium callunae]|uniref:SpaH/EbpB family LPXTG-anchored major pilin n=1 Tax=Corynebacterium callunae TaxID=1721 RepID=UPI003981C8DE
MFNFATRSRIQAAGALIITTMLVLFVALFGGTTAQAQTAQPVPESAKVTITKLSQQGDLGSAATGVKTDLPKGTERINGVVFQYYLVDNTGIGGSADIGTNAGQKLAASVTAATASIPQTPTGSFIATVNGETSATLSRGLYVIKEDPTSVPAGVTAAAPFLLSVPLTDPENLNQWLTDIYVYPKNSQIAATKTVNNAAALVVGNDVTWTISADIPRVQNPAAKGATDKFLAPDYFRIDDTLQDTQLVLNPAFAEDANTSISVKAGETSLIEGTDYKISQVVSNPAGSKTYQILFTDDGRAALATAVNAKSDAKVTVELDTTVKSASKIENTASIYPDSASTVPSVDKPNGNPLVTPATDVRYGSYNFQKLSSDTKVTDLSGAEFRVYADEEDAKAGNDNYLNPTDSNEGLWTSDKDGHVSISGLRYSGYANGKIVNKGEEGYITYYLVETKALDGHQLLAEPVAFIVGDTTGTSTSEWKADQDITNQATTGAFVLPLTGGSGTTMLTIAGIAILAIVLFLARRRSAAEA